MILTKLLMRSATVRAAVSPVVVAFVLSVLASFFSTAAATATEDVYSAPSVKQLRTDVDQWLEQRDLARSPAPDAIQPFWEFDHPPTPEERFDALMQTFYLVDDEVRALVERCSNLQYDPALTTLEPPSTQRTNEEPLLGHNVRYFLARHLSMLTAYNEAMEIFHQIDPHFVVDPAGLLFYQSVCEHHLLMRDQGLESLDSLLNRTEDIPVRYRELGELMLQDLQGVKEESLAEVARQMKDVERRLNLSRTDDDVQEVERKIVETLDKLIKQMEDQQQQQQQMAANGSGSSAPQQGASDTYLGGIRGEGLTDKKDIGNEDNWGDLPPKAREAAKNMLDRQFPSHYRQAVEEYLKKLADRPAP